MSLKASRQKSSKGESNLGSYGHELATYFWGCFLSSAIIIIEIISLKLFGNLWGNSYTKFAILDIKFPFTCGKLDMY